MKPCTSGGEHVMYLEIYGDRPAVLRCEVCGEEEPFDEGMDES